jgi:hypothetical protein
VITSYRASRFRCHFVRDHEGVGRRRAVSEQARWDRLVSALLVGTINVADGYICHLRESDAMLTSRRKADGDPKAARLQDITARMVEFTVTSADRAGHCSFSRFRVLIALLDLYPAAQVAACYAERWQVEVAYKTIKSSLRGSSRRLRGQSPDLAEQVDGDVLAGTERKELATSRWPHHTLTRRA